MKLLLTSGGISNKSIEKTLIKLLEKPICECNALCIPTSVYALPNGANLAANFINGEGKAPMCELGFKSIDILELSALSIIDKEVWVPKVKEADIILVNGGDPLFLYYWMIKSGFNQIINELDSVYVGMSAGSMVLTPKIGKDFINWFNDEISSDNTLNIVNFSIFPHLEHPMLLENTIQNAQIWSESIGIHSYAIDDQTAILVVDDKIEIISEGKWIEYNKEE
jgi:dipeptidase E